MSEQVIGQAIPERLLTFPRGLEARDPEMARHMTGQIVTFPILNRMFGVDSLAKRLNALVSAGQIAGWHPERWIDWDHTAIQISFDSVEDATFASKRCLEITEKLPAAGGPAAMVRSA